MAKHNAEHESASSTTASGLPIIYVTVTRDMLARAWAQYASQHAMEVTERVQYYRTSENGTWQAGSIAVGVSMMEYGQHEVTLRKRILQDSLFTLKRDFGHGGRHIQEMRDTWPPAGTRLSIKVPLADSCLRYQLNEATQRNEPPALKLHWSGRPTYERSDGNYSWSALIEYYNRSKCSVLYPMPPSSSPLLHQLQGDFVNRAGELDIHFNLLDSLPHAISGDMPPATVVSDQIVISFLALIFPEVLLPGMAPLQRHWVGQLFVPPSTARYSYGAFWPVTGYFVAGYECTASRHQPIDSKIEQLPLTITPAFRVVSAGAQRQTLAFEPAGVVAQCTLAAGAVGVLENVSGQWFYQPAHASVSAAMLEVNNKTNVPALIRSSKAFPLAVDVVTARSGSRTANSSFLTIYTQPTHYFKAHVQAGKIRLALWYTSFAGQATEVPAEKVRWTVKFGNGSVDAGGVFTAAASQPTPYTVVMAEDPDANYLYWAYLVMAVPALEPERMAEYINS